MHYPPSTCRNLDAGRVAIFFWLNQHSGCSAWLRLTELMFVVWRSGFILVTSHHTPNKFYVMIGIKSPKTPPTMTGMMFGNPNWPLKAIPARVRFNKELSLKNALSNMFFFEGYPRFDWEEIEFPWSGSRELVNTGVDIIFPHCPEGFRGFYAFGQGRIST